MRWLVRCLDCEYAQIAPTLNAGTTSGAVATAARRIGLTLAEYAHNVNAGLKWCFGCKAWHPVDHFGADRTRGDGRARACRAARRRSYKARYIPKAQRVPSV